MARPDCPLCNGSGWKTVARPENNPELKRIAAPAVRPSVEPGEQKMVWAVPCECTTNDRASRIFARSRIPERYRDCDFENFETDVQYHSDPAVNVNKWHRSLEGARCVVQGFAREYPAGVEQGLVLMGPCGVGKTHLAVAALKELSRRGHQCLFCVYGELLKTIQSTYNSESADTELGVLEPVLKAEILLVDDLGSNRPSDWTREMVGLIFDQRYNEKRTTLVTTNFLDKEFDRAYIPQGALIGQTGNSVDRDAQQPTQELWKTLSAPPLARVESTFADRVGARIRSRLYEMCRTIEMCAPDYRQAARASARSRG